MDTVMTSAAISGIGQIAINARDLERAVAFYRDALGLRFLFQPPGLAFFDCGGVRLMLSGAESPELDHPSSVLYFRVADIREAHASLAARGVVFRDAPHKIADMPDHELWMTFFDDSEGNLLALMAEVPRAG
jgi:methylmalonyl-CoA/ethylmalonyl-CoA epimerase